MFSVVRASDPAELDSRSRVSDRLPGSSRDYRYKLRDRALWRMRFDTPILAVAIRSAGSILASHGESRFETEVSMKGGESDVFAFSAPLRGSMTLIHRGVPITANSSGGLVCRLASDTRLVTSDDSVRTNVFVKVAQAEEALEHMLDRRLTEPLAFSPSLDWGHGLAASLKSQLDFVLQEFDRPDGIATNAVALASTTDLILTLILRGAKHNHTHHLDAGPSCAVPAYVHRAEEFMRANSASPIRVADIAAAAGCSVRTLNAVFQRFRGQVPLAALQAIRLALVHTELSQGADGLCIGAVSRRYGFTNASRFNLAFQRRHGETPRDVIRRASRS
ncbi:AraC family transcriptional regulator [Sediminicoccus sp. KRV36]|uniref:AraC family transcriptional regulator n=1 Tax=Sediminicoccus sp. KRV36 TaxID=3133721 RepID=UPI00200C8AB1|nr:AraC family transcriptional regulator [Sediminicoccus rosea]UPY37868.1 AraC family transcriptional regulator [Sediminicoccus rosea]